MNIAKSWIHPPLLYSLLLTGLAFPLTGCMVHQGPPQMPPIPVEVSPVNISRVEENTEYLGNLISRHSVTLESKAPGIIRNIYVKPGDVVRQGQTLLEIRDDEERSGLNSSVAESQATQVTIKQAQKAYESLLSQRKGLQSSLELNETQLGRYQRLKELKSASQEEVDRYADSVKRLQSELEANAAQLQSQQEAIRAAHKNYERSVANIGQQQAKLNDHIIRAPFSGMVGEIPVKVGGYVQPLTQLLTITDNKSLELNLDLPAEYLARMKLGLPLEIVQDGKVIATAPVSFIAPNVSVETQTVLIKAIFPNKDNLLRADQSVHTRLVWAKKQGILVPVTSVLHLGGKDFVYFLEKDEKAPMGWVAKQHPIELGSIQGDSYVVLKGIKPGIQLITAGIQKLMDGAPVMLPGQFPSKEKK